MLQLFLKKSATSNLLISHIAARGHCKFF